MKGASVRPTGWIAVLLVFIVLVLAVVVFGIVEVISSSSSCKEGIIFVSPQGTTRNAVVRVASPAFTSTA